MVRNIPLFKLRSTGFFIPINRLHLDKIDDAFKIVFGTDRHLQGDGVRSEATADLLYDSEKIRAGTVHLVDEGHPRNAVFVRLAPHGLRLGLHTPYRTEDAYRAIKHT